MKTGLFLYSIYFLFACSDYSEPKVFELKSPKEQNAQEDTLGYDCVRSVPEPVLDSTKFPNWSFKLEKIPEGNVLQGLEYALLKNGTRLKIINSGCEYYSLLFEFTTSNHSEKTTNLVYWAKTTIALLKEIKPHCDAPVDWEILEKKLLNYYKADTKRELNHELVINDSEIGTVAYLEKLEQLDDKTVKISLHYSIGPL